MVDLELVSSNEPVSEFLHYLYDGIDGYACAPVKTVDPENPEGRPLAFQQKFFHMPDQLDVMRDWILANSNEKDVYVSPALFDRPDLHREYFKASNVVWTEFDGNTPTNTLDIPQPTCRIKSSSESHQHWYWKLDAPITVRTELEAINRSITYSLHADASSWDCSQILRPPGTRNHKRESDVRLLESNTEKLQSSIFSTLDSIPEPESTFTLSTIPDVSEVVLRYSFKDEVIQLYKTREFPVGQRSAALMKLGYFLAEMGMSDAEMFAVLRNADDRWKKFKDRTDRDRRLVDLITKARIKYPTLQIVDEDVTPLYGFQSFLDTEIEIEWLIPDVLQTLGYMLLTGKSGVGKTQYSLRWAISLALGKPFLRHEVTRPLRILFMSCEMGHADLKYFVSRMATQLSGSELLLLEQNLILVPLGEPFYIDNEPGQKKFEAILDTVKPDIFMWDSLGSATGAQLSDEITVKRIMDFNDRVRQRYSVASWFIHHNRKATSDNKKPTKQEDIYGNQWIVNRATTVYCLHPHAQGIEVIPLKKRLAELENPWIIERIGSTLDFVRKAEITLSSPETVVDAPQEGMTDAELIQNPTGEWSAM